MPGLKVVVPYTAADAKGLLKAAIRDPNPVIFLENEILYGQSFPVPGSTISCCRSARRASHRQGKDVTIVSFGIGMTYALKAAEELAKEGIEAEVIDLRTIRPMDVRPWSSRSRRPGAASPSRKAFRNPASAAEIAARIMEEAFDYLDAPRHARHRQGRADALRGQPEKLALPNVADVVQAAKAVSYR